MVQGGCYNGLKCDISVSFRFALLCLHFQQKLQVQWVSCSADQGGWKTLPLDVSYFNISHCTVPYSLLYGIQSSMPENFCLWDRMNALFLSVVMWIAWSVQLTSVFSSFWWRTLYKVSNIANIAVPDLTVVLACFPTETY